MGKNKNKQSKQDSVADDQQQDTTATSPLVADVTQAVQEERKQEVSAQGAPLKRSNSKFDMQDNDKQTLYRPQFNTGKEGTRDKMWELMSSYIGNDQQSI